MSQLNLYPLPYTASEPPQELVQSGETVSRCSNTAVFNTNVKNRDVFLGEPRCVVCGTSGSYALDHCRIVGRSDVAMVRQHVQLGSHAVITYQLLVVITHTIGMGPTGHQRLAY